jgi:hypothetical protein
MDEDQLPQPKKSKTMVDWGGFRKVRLRDQESGAEEQANKKLRMAAKAKAQETASSWSAYVTNLAQKFKEWATNRVATAAHRTAHAVSVTTGAEYKDLPHADSPVYASVWQGLGFLQPRSTGSTPNMYAAVWGSLGFKGAGVLQSAEQYSEAVAPQVHKQKKGDKKTTAAGRKEPPWSKDLKLVALSTLRTVGFSKGCYTDAAKILKTSYAALFDVPGVRTITPGLLKYWHENGIEDRRSGNALPDEFKSRSLPTVLEEEVLDLMFQVVKSKVEVDTTTLRPLILGWIAGSSAGKWAQYLQDDGKRKGFMASDTWIQTRLHAEGFSYRKETNCSGKLPDNWQQLIDDFIVRVAYVIGKHAIPEELVCNLDETPQFLDPKKKRTWATTGAKNVPAAGSVDKRQFTMTPVITASGDLVLMQLIFQGSTVGCLPDELFRSAHAELFEIMVWSFTDNHWQGKQSIQQVLKRLELYRKATIVKLGLPADQKLLLIWDVYCRHRDHDLLQDFLPAHCPNFIILFVPANMTELAQPLDVGFNFQFKNAIANARNIRNATAAAAWLRAGQSAEDFKVDTKLSTLKHPLCLMVATEAAVWLAADKKKAIRANCWGKPGLLRCFDPGFQMSAIRKVDDDTDGKYFKRVGDTGEARDPALDTYLQQGSGSGAAGSAARKGKALVTKVAYGIKFGPAGEQEVTYHSALIVKYHSKSTPKTYSIKFYKAADQQKASKNCKVGKEVVESWDLAAQE